MLEVNGGAVVEWVGDGDGRFDPAQTVRGEGKAANERAGDAEGVAGGTEIVMEAGEGDFGGGTGAADGGVALVDRDSDSALRERDGGSEAVGTGADDVGGLERHVTCDATAKGGVGEGVWEDRVWKVSDVPAALRSRRSPVVMRLRLACRDGGLGFRQEFLV